MLGHWTHLVLAKWNCNENEIETRQRNEHKNYTLSSEEGQFHILNQVAIRIPSKQKPTRFSAAISINPHHPTGACFPPHSGIPLFTFCCIQFRQI